MVDPILNTTHSRPMFLAVVLFVGMLTMSLQHVSAQITSSSISTTANTFNRFLNDTFPLLAMESADHSIFNTASLTGKTVYVDFWFTSCPHCLKDIGPLKQLQQYFLPIPTLFS